MITTLLKQLRLSQLLLLMGGPFVIALALLIGITALHAPAFSLLSLAHAMMLRSTCASTQGTQPNLCNQQNPAMQGCTQDAQTLEGVSVFTPQNALIGEVDLMHSTTCKTMWVRTIAYANAGDVQAIDATISLNDGQVQDHQTHRGHAGQRLVAATDMVQFSVFPKTLAGIFHLQG
jgi:hypothetical protein